MPYDDVTADWPEGTRALVWHPRREERMEAIIVRRYTLSGQQAADVRFLHAPDKVSEGHFTSAFWNVL